MSTRREFLLHMFRLLDERALPFCVMRNYENLLDDPASDVDLLAASGDVPAVMECLSLAAQATGHRLVQKTRFANHSLVFWNGQDGYVRIDVDMEVRWRIFHILTAREILRARRRQDAFYVPDPIGESVIILTKLVWMNRVTGRYAERLRALSGEIADRRELRAVFQKAFGIDEDLLAQNIDDALCTRLRRAIALNVLRRPQNFARMAGYVANDALRVCGRIQSPPGIILRIAAARDVDAEALIDALRILFPKQKSCVSAGLVGGWMCFKKLFRGGLLIETRRTEDDSGLGLMVRKLSPAFFLSRAFVGVVESGGRTHLAHAGTGCMGSTGTGVALPVAECAHFICTALARNAGGMPPFRGVFAVVLGLDGSGKTTFARNICILVTGDCRFTGARYFHWIPRVFGRVEFPFPAFRETERKIKARPGVTASVLSVVRLVKNVVRANLAFYFRIRPLLRRGRLVLADRFFYNYWLDPVSVRYSGPAWLLAAALPLFPKPDAVIVLRANADTLLSRKRELSPVEIAAQIARLDRLPLRTQTRIDLNAAEPADDLAHAAFVKLSALATPRK